MACRLFKRFRRRSVMSYSYIHRFNKRATERRRAAALFVSNIFIGPKDFSAALYTPSLLSLSLIYPHSGAARALRDRNGTSSYNNRFSLSPAHPLFFPCSLTSIRRSSLWLRVAITYTVYREVCGKMSGKRKEARERR